MLYKEIPWLAPEHCFAPFSHMPWAILLHSARLDDSFGRYSYIGIDPFSTVVYNENCSEFVFDQLKNQLALYSLPTETQLPPFQGGVLGLFGYELLHEIESLPKLPHESLPFPDAALGFYDTVIAFDNHLKKVWLISTGFPETDFTKRTLKAQERLEWLETQIEVTCFWMPPLHPVGLGWHGNPDFNIQSNFNLETYTEAVQKTIGAILEGDFFEANISQQFRLSNQGIDSWTLYLATLKYTPAPFSVFFNTPSGTIVSASPERFLLCENNKVTTCPIKGTRPRHSDSDKDQALATELLNSDKDRAENIMIVDLMRNDLSKVCQPHTVQVTKLCALESFSTVHHLVSTVEGVLKECFGPIDLLKACFPGGSITGAPKIEVMRHIQQIEQVRRGPYCGSLGYIGFNRNLDTSIVIRTYTITPETIYFQTGGAVTLDSIPAEEYQETLDKAYGLVKALKEVYSL